MTDTVWWVGYRVARGRVTWHSAEYDPRKDVDRLRPFVETTCGRFLNPSRIVLQAAPAIGDRVCRACYRLTHPAGQGSFGGVTWIDPVPDGVDRNTLLPV